MDWLRFTSTVNLLRESVAFQSISKRLRRRTMSSPEVCWPVPMRAIGAQNLLTMPGGVSTAGYLHKKGGSQFSLMKWPLRYIIIHKGCVYYFKSSTSAAPQGAFSLNGYNRVMRAAEETTSNNVFPFKIVHFSKKHRTWFLSAASEDERRKWMRNLRREIDHYNDRKESLIPSDSDSDADSFYGTIERPMDITHHDSNADDDYVEEDDEDEDEEDYLKPDTNCSSPPAGRPTGPPPSYPPPPVPPVFQLRPDSGLSFAKGLPPPIPSQHRTSTTPIPRKPPPPFPPPLVLRNPSKGPTPVPFMPSSSDSPPPPPPPNPKRTPPLNKAPSTCEPGSSKNDWRPLSTISNQFASTLPICEQLETRLVQNVPAHCSMHVGGSQSLDNSHPRRKPPLLLHQSPNTEGSTTRPGIRPQSLSPCHPPLPSHPPISPQLRPGLCNKPGATKPPPPPAIKPPAPAPKPKPPGAPLQRSSPEGQSFRSSGEEVPLELRRKQVPVKGGDDSDDDDYENVQLPDSVFIDTTETSFVEKLFKEGLDPPGDGLYGIRNSGTKTSRVLVVWDVGLAKARNYRLFEDKDQMFLDSEVTFPSLSALIEHYHNHPLPHHGSLCLQKPFMRLTVNRAHSSIAHAAS